MTGDGIIPPRPFGALPLSQGESLMSHPQHSDIDKTYVQSADRPFVSVAERPTVGVVETPRAATVETPETIAHPTVSTIAHPTVSTITSVVLENLVNRVGTEEHPVAAISTPIAPVLEPIATVETPVAVDKPIGTSVEHSVRVAVEESGDASVNAPIPADSVRRSVDENPVVASPERPAIQVSATIPEEPIVIVEKTPTLSADKPVASAVEASKVVAVEKPVVPAVEAPKVATVHPTVATVEVPKVVTTEKPLTVVLPTAHTIVPAVVENLKGRVEVEEQPMAASAILASPTTPTTSSRTPGIAVNSCVVPSIEKAVIAAPFTLESNTLRSELPRVLPYPG